MWRPINLPELYLYFLDKDNWPVEQVYRQPIRNLIRLLLHTRRISTEWVITDMECLNSTAKWSFSKEEIDNLVEKSNQVWERINAERFFAIYRPMMEPPRTVADELSQRGFNKILFTPFVTPRTHIGLIGPIDSGKDEPDTDNMMKPEE